MRPHRGGDRPVVIGLGNPERGDDGLGPVVVGLLEGPLGGFVELLASVSDPMSILDLWEEAPVAILVDAVRSGGVPGVVYRWEVTPGDLPMARAWSSTHSLGLRELVELSWALGRSPRRLVLYGAEAGEDRWGQGLSEPVSAAAFTIARRLHQELEQDGWLVARREEELHA
jgi:hydrogenase maturation protease